MNELALFAGAGGGILGGHLLGWRCVCAVEYNAYARSVLLARQNDGTLPPFPIWDDVRTFDGRAWRGVVDVVSGGFPCQDISAAAGGKAAGIDGERSGLWTEMARIVGEVRPSYVLVENSPILTSRGLGRVLGDLADLGFDAEWGVLGAADVGAPHQRDRIWILAYSTQLQRNGGDYHAGKRVESKAIPKPGNGGWSNDVADPISIRHSRSEGERLNSEDEKRVSQTRRSEWNAQSDTAQPSGEVSNPECFRLEQVEPPDGIRADCEGPASALVSSAWGWWATEPAVGRMADGVAYRVDRLKALGNGQVPRVAATAFRVLTET